MVFKVPFLFFYKIYSSFLRGGMLRVATARTPPRAPPLGHARNFTSPTAPFCSLIGAPHLQDRSAKADTRITRAPKKAKTFWERGGARKRAEFSPYGGNGAKRTLLPRGHARSFACLTASLCSFVGASRLIVYEILSP